jgi:hypothetical protein
MKTLIPIAATDCRLERGEAPAASGAQMQYEAAVAEFDRLWETCAAKTSPERMQQLLAIIDAVELG